MLLNDNVMSDFIFYLFLKYGNCNRYGKVVFIVICKLLIIVLKLFWL